MIRIAALLLALAACRPEGDHCNDDRPRCDGDSILICRQAGANDEVLGHRSNYYDRSPKTSKRTCLDGQSATASLRGRELRSAPMIREALKDVYVETALSCPVCGGDASDCNN